MKDINNLKDYRLKFKRYYGIEFGKEYAVHHINLDHYDNRIENLMLLPTKLHSQYHFYKTVIENSKMPTNITGNALSSQLYYANKYIDDITAFAKILVECNKWFDYKLYLDGVIQNIHNIKLNRGE